MPSIFSDIVSSGKIDPLQKYAATFEGAEIADVATIAQAEAFVPVIQGLAMLKRNAYINPPVLEAVPATPKKGGAAVAAYIPVEEMLADGFPKDKPCRLVYRWTRRTGFLRTEVRDLIHTYYTNPMGPAAVWDEIGGV